MKKSVKRAGAGSDSRRNGSGRGGSAAADHDEAPPPPPPHFVPARDRDEKSTGNPSSRPRSALSVALSSRMRVREPLMTLRKPKVARGGRRCDIGRRVEARTRPPTGVCWPVHRGRAANGDRSSRGTSSWGCKCERRIMVFLGMSPCRHPSVSAVSSTRRGWGDMPRFLSWPSS